MHRRKAKRRVGRSRAQAWLTRVPWWLAFAIAAGGWYYLSRYAALKPMIPPVHSLSDLETLARVGSPWAGAYVGQFAVPAFFGVLGVCSWFRRWRDSRLMRKAVANPRNLVEGMDWEEFEHLIGEIFRGRGYRVTLTERGADGGVDLILSRGRARSFVQCKQWKSTRVGVGVVRELYGVMASEGVEEGFVVTSGTFTDQAIDFAQGLNIQLVDYYVLCEWLGVKPGRARSR